MCNTTHQMCDAEIFFGFNETWDLYINFKPSCKPHLPPSSVNSVRGVAVRDGMGYIYVDRSIKEFLYGRVGGMCQGLGGWEGDPKIFGVWFLDNKKKLAIN